ncbi:diflavin oxidoreductase [Gallaecimonas pentaromativorans]|uniref:assimilatory sulfite reductase (NADPH) n=1 Tax=Gallaecimonas pentaromativorans TaxID=584787 RepID=A0A3N1PP59_9GAMM|nr:flavodoxin domain-containing protein [Gallaecimonas pentaromativorans]ROQ30525.1 sulfite reductase (NADPH) alpha subunit [Gallaecimonas pentaromativorans]
MSHVLTQLTQAVREQLSQLSSDDLRWMSGYLAGLADAKAGTGSVVAAPAATAAASRPLLVLYGSQTGNAEGVAKTFADAAKAAGLDVTLASMAGFKAKKLSDAQDIALVVSTHGDGEAPDDAIALHELLGSKRAPDLSQTRFSVLALGDSSYPLFCQTGKDFDERLAAAGSERLLTIKEADVEFQATAQAWQDELLAALADAAPQVQSAAEVSSSAAPQPTRANPMSAEVLAVHPLTIDAGHEVYHLELDVPSLSYQPGDALGIVAQQSDALVQAVLDATRLNADEPVTLDGKKVRLFDALKGKELTTLHPKTVAELQLSEGEGQLPERIRTRSESLTAQQLIDALKPLAPRLYSIASSPKEAEGEVHLTIALVAFEAEGQARFGVASGLVSRLEAGDELKVYVQPNNRFRLPDADKPVIMIGPGTGMAPFRAFMQEREATQAQGRNWLFFGSRHLRNDFLYQTEWQRWLSEGQLSKLSLAFSRDQQDKIYVQHRLKEEGAEVWQWLNDGAYLYVCGDGERMAKDVHQALADLIASHGNTDGETYLNELRAQGRYLRDVY